MFNDVERLKRQDAAIRKEREAWILVKICQESLRNARVKHNAALAELHDLKV